MINDDRTMYAGLGMGYAATLHQLIWGDFFYQLKDIFRKKYFVIQEPKTTAKGKYYLPDISVLRTIDPNIPDVTIEISNNDNLKKAKLQQTNILDTFKNAECFIYNYDTNEWLKRSGKNYVNDSFCIFLNFDLAELFNNSEYKERILTHIQNSNNTTNNSLAGMF